MSPKALMRTAAALVLGVALAGCGAAATEDTAATTHDDSVEAPLSTEQSQGTTPDDTPTPTVPPAPTTAAPPNVDGTIQHDVCTSLDSVAISTITDGWDLVTASRGISDHSDMVRSLFTSLSDITNRAEAPCRGAPEVESLNSAVIDLNTEVSGSAEAAEASYQTVADAGNNLLEAIGFTGYEFTTTYSD